METMQRRMDNPGSFKRTGEREKQKEFARVERIRAKPYQRDEILIH